MYSMVFEMETEVSAWVLEAIERGKQRERDRGKPYKYFPTEESVVEHEKVLQAKEDKANETIRQQRKERYIQWCMRRSKSTMELRNPKENPYD